MAIERQTAVIATIEQLQKGRYVIKEGWTPNYIEAPQGQISRTNVMGVIVQEHDPGIWTLDDGSGQVRLRNFEEKKPLASVGDVVMVIARPRQYNDQLFLNYEIIKKLSPAWLEYRKKELTVLYADLPEQLVHESTTPPMQTATVEVPPENLFTKVLDVIRKLDAEDNGQGAAFDEVIEKVESKEAQHILNSLLAEGEIFEIRPGKVKVLE